MGIGTVYFVNNLSPNLAQSLEYDKCLANKMNDVTNG